MQYLALQVRDVDRVEVRQVQLANASRRQVQRHGRTEAAEADDQHPTVFQAQLTVDIYLRQEDLPAVAQQFLIGQHDSRPRVMRSWALRSRRLSICSKSCLASSSRTAAAWS
ncbi:hypothetical protein D3C85_1636280 [compost metagenome]